MGKELVVRIVGDASSLNRALDESSQKTKGFGSKIGGLGKVALGAAGAAGVGALVYTLKTGIGEWEASQKVAAQTKAVLKSTGGVAHVTAGQVSDLAGALLKKSGIDDEAIASGENMLLTFKGIRNEAGKNNDIFNQATSVLTDMTVAINHGNVTQENMSKQAIQLGKALNDPVAGLGALRRVGVTFTDGQKKMIEQLVKSGHTMEAQKIILHELNSEFGGSAEALGNTLPGKINIVRETFNNWAGDLVGKLIPVLTDLANWTQEHWPEISATIQKFWADVQPGLQAFLDIIGSIVSAIQNNWNTIGPVVDGVGTAVGAGLQLMLTPLQLIADILTGDWSKLWSDFAAAPKTFIHGIEGLFKPIGSLIKKALVAGIVGISSEAWDVINNIGAFLVGKADAIAAWGLGIAKNMIGAYIGAWVGIGSKAWEAIKAIGGAIADKVDTIAGWGATIGGAIKNGVITVLGNLGNFFVALIKAPINALIKAWNAIKIPRLEVDTHIPGIGKVGFGPIDFPNIPLLAAGGSLQAGQMALVGEKGPEIFIPGTSGTVLPNGAGTGPMVVNLILDGKVAAQALIDPLRGEARIYKQQTGKAAFA